MASGTYYPAVSGDDGYWYGGQFYNSFDYCSLGDNGADGCNTFIRFANVTIPQGSTITSAYIKGTAKENNTEAVLLNIYGNDVDNAVAPTSAAEGNSLVDTTAFVVWDFTPAWTSGSQYDTPSLVTILQEIVDRGSFASGNAIQIVIYDDGSTSGHDPQFSAIDYDGGSEKAELHVEWTE